MRLTCCRAKKASVPAYSYRNIGACFLPGRRPPPPRRPSAGRQYDPRAAARRRRARTAPQQCRPPGSAAEARSQHSALAALRSTGMEIIFGAVLRQARAWGATSDAAARGTGIRGGLLGRRSDALPEGLPPRPDDACRISSDIGTEGAAKRRTPAGRRAFGSRRGLRVAGSRTASIRRHRPAGRVCSIPNLPAGMVPALLSRPSLPIPARPAHCAAQLTSTPLPFAHSLNSIISSPA